MMRYAIAIAVLLGSAHAAHAQTAADVILVTSSQASDFATTTWALRQGGYEKNPLLQSYAHNPAKLGAVRTATGAYFLGMARYLRAHDHPKWARVMTWGSSGFFSAVAARNIYAGHKSGGR